MSDVVQIEPIAEADEALDARIAELRSEGLSLPRIARRLMIPLHELHRRIDALLPVIDAGCRRRTVAESLVQMDTIISTHMKLIADPESASIVIRATCEKRALLGLSGSNYDPVQLVAVGRDRSRSIDAWERRIAAALGKPVPPLPGADGE